MIFDTLLRKGSVFVVFNGWRRQAVSSSLRLTRLRVTKKKQKASAQVSGLLKLIIF
jgi:hypothetical protein